MLRGEKYHSPYVKVRLAIFSITRLASTVNLSHQGNIGLGDNIKTMATQKTFKLTIAKVSGSEFDGEVVSVTVPGSEGEMTLLADHAPIVSVLKAGTITALLTDGSKKEFAVTTGTLEVSHNTVTVLL